LAHVDERRAATARSGLSVWQLGLDRFAAEREGAQRPALS
jgi:hypothetical protein